MRAKFAQAGIVTARFAAARSNITAQPSENPARHTTMAASASETTGTTDEAVAGAEDAAAPDQNQQKH